MGSRPCIRLLPLHARPQEVLHAIAPYSPPPPRYLASSQQTREGGYFEAAVDARIFRADVLVLGFGAFIHPSEETGTHLEEWLRRIRQRHGFNGTVVWIEYFGGHLPSADGEYHQRDIASYRGRSNCSALANRSHALANPRRVSSNRVAEAWGVPILRTFEAAAPAVNDHPACGIGACSRPPPDCRHWCLAGRVLRGRNLELAQLLRGAEPRPSHEHGEEAGWMGADSVAGRLYHFVLDGLPPLLWWRGRGRTR